MVFPHGRINTRMNVVFPAPSQSRLTVDNADDLTPNGCGDLASSARFVLGMQPEHRALLRAHRLELSGQLLVSDSIVPFLYQESVLTESQVEEIESQPSSRQKTLKLLDILPSRGPRAFGCFLRSLDEFSWIRDGLLQELREGPGPGPTGVSTPSGVTRKPVRASQDMLLCIL